MDAINFYMDEEAELQRACDEEREIAHKTAIGIAFVTFESEMQAQRYDMCVYIFRRVNERSCFVRQL